MYKLYFDKYCHVNNTSFNVITGASLCTYMVRMKKRKHEASVKIAQFLQM